MDITTELHWLELSNLDSVDLLMLKKKYRKLTLKYHPDKGGKTEDFVALQAAYHFLQDCIKYPNSHKANSQSNSKQDSTSYSSNDSKDIEFYKNQIDELTRSNKNYQNLINGQIKTIKQFYNNLDQINSQNDNYNSNLGKLLDDELTKLDKKYKSGWWKGVIGLKYMDKNDLISYQNSLIGEHNELLSKSQKENFQANFKEYKQVVDQIVQGINGTN
jgi:curved DNA-binding protein CbpA